MPNDDKFLLFAPGIVEILKTRANFREYLANFYAEAASEFGCSVSLSGRRLGEVFAFWTKDVERTLAFDADDVTEDLDHFKHAAFIAFWLRRLIPINDIWFDRDDPSDDSSATEDQTQFYQYGNEICALYAGFYICLAYELDARVEARKKSKLKTPRQPVGVRNVPSYFRDEFPRLLKKKSISPQSLYMTYRSLFDTLAWELAAVDVT